MLDSIEAANAVRYFVFDIESVADPALVSLVRTSGKVEPREALRAYRDELIQKKGNDFIPYTYHVPVSVAIAKIRGDLSLEELLVLKIEDGGPKRLCERFWDGWLYYNRPQFVTFNGRGFDLPLMELTAYRYGLRLNEWFDDSGPGYAQPRNRFNKTFHLDLNAELTNFGATAFDGGLNLAAKLLHLPGKIDTKGDMVQDLFDAGRLDEIHRYCKCDVLDTYFVFLRCSTLKGRISLARERELREEVRSMLEANVEKEPVFLEYLNAWRQNEDFLTQHDAFAKYEA